MKGKMKLGLLVQIDLQTNTDRYIELALKRVGTVAGLWREPLQTWAHRALSERHEQCLPEPEMSNGTIIRKRHT